MINVGIVGYGNVGKAVEKEIQNNKNFKLVAIFSKNTEKNVLSMDKLIKFKSKIKILFICVGSQSDLEDVSFNVIKNFNTIDCYDNHNRLQTYLQKLNILAQQNNTCAISACGWDPGLFSLMRGIISALGYNENTFWGKGISQGHTQAIKNIKGVIDALQFTIPKKRALKNATKGTSTNSKQAHKRLCYVVCEKTNKKQVKQKILSMRDYFLGYKTKVKFVTQKNLNKLKTFSHKGIVLSVGGEIKLNLNLKSNPQFTARVLVAYANALNNLIKSKLFGAYSVFDIPVSLLKFNKSICL